MDFANPRVAFLYSEPSPYMVACWRDLKVRCGAGLLIVHKDASPLAPFDIDIGEFGRAVAREDLTRRDLLRELEDFRPDGIFISGWADRDYMFVSRRMRSRGVQVILGLDTQWTGSIRQRIGCASARWWLHPSVDVIWTPGERQAQLARNLGYLGASCWYGLYCCDWDAFSDAEAFAEPRERSFLFVGRYVEEKGIADLVAAYSEYRRTHDNPWPLYCVGSGPLKHLLGGVPGIVDLGFQNPKNLPRLMRRHGGVFVLPSRHEPWGVVLQEAAASRCPLVCADSCGAGVHLLQEGHNGLRFAAGKPRELAACLGELAGSSDEKRRRMGEASAGLALQYTPRRWSEVLMGGLRRGV